MSEEKNIEQFTGDSPQSTENEKVAEPSTIIDRNPQKYVLNIFEAKESDYIKAEQKVYFNTYLELPIVRE